MKSTVGLFNAVNTILIQKLSLKSSATRGNKMIFHEGTN